MRTCKNCRTDFSPGHHHQLYCTPRCRDLQKRRSTRPAKKCRECGQEFEAVANQQYCGDPCKPPSRPTPIDRACGWCGTIFQVGPTSQRQYCDSECRGKAKEARRQEDRECKRCGTTFRTSDRRQRYCSSSCANRENNPPRELHPDFEYSNAKSWRGALDRLSGGACADCGTTEGEIHGHHIVPQARGGKHTLRNGVLLCKSCHAARHMPVDGELVEQIARRVLELLQDAGAGEKIFLKPQNGDGLDGGGVPVERAPAPVKTEDMPIASALASGEGVQNPGSESAYNRLLRDQGKR